MIHANKDLREIKENCCCGVLLVRTFPLYICTFLVPLNTSSSTSFNDFGEMIPPCLIKKIGIILFLKLVIYYLLGLMYYLKQKFKQSGNTLLKSKIISLIGS